jgi:malate dehydrogenase
MARKKVSIIGAGSVGSTVAHLLALKGLADVVMVDIAEGIARGKALDIAEAAPLEGFDCMVTGGGSYEETANSDIAVITAGSPRKPGMTREDLLKTNASVVSYVTKEFVKRSPKGVIIVVTNPLDAMAYVAWRASGFQRSRVMGMAGVLDSTRLRFFVAQELGVPPRKVASLVLGSHGDSMVPLVRHTTIDGKPITALLPEDKIDALVERTRKGGAEIVNLLKNGSAYYAPAASVTRMITAVLTDEKAVLPCSAYLEGEYGVKGCFMGVPVKLGSRGIEEIVELELDDNERRMLTASAEESKKLVKSLGY